VAKLTVKAGSTSRLEHVFILDSTSTTGAGKTALTSASVTAFYFRPGDTTTTGRSITLAAGTLGTWSSGGFIQVNATDMPGLYEIGIPNAIFAAGVNHAVVMIKGTGIAPVLLEYDLVAYDPLDTVRLGLTAMPNVASGSAGAILTSGTGTAQLNVTSGNVSGSVASVATGGITSGSFATDAITSTVLAASAATEIAGAVWDEAYASHLTAGTFGKLMDLLRKGCFVTEGTVLATGSPANSTTIFRTNVNTAVNNFYNNQTLVFVTGALAGQAMQISAYTYITTSDSSFATSDALTGTPATGDTFVVLGNHVWTQAQIADGILRRKLDSSGDGNGTQEERTVLTALQVLRNASAISGSTLTVYKENDTTAAWTAAVSSSAGMNPLTGIDPT
jgi:hypothetical protein